MCNFSIHDKVLLTGMLLDNNLFHISWSPTPPPFCLVNNHFLLLNDLGNNVFFLTNDIIYSKRVEEWAKPHNELVKMWFKFAFGDNRT